MRPCTPVLLALLLSILHASGAHAQTAIHQCVASNGTPVFTDQACASVDSTAVAAHASSSAGGHPAVVAVGCPATLRDLKVRVAEAFRAHDANSLAGLMLWTGSGRAAATADLHYLRSLVQETLMGMDDGSGPESQRDPASVAGMATPSAVQGNAATRESPVPRTLTLHLGGIGDDAGHNPHFAVSRVADCLWLSSAPE